MMRCVLILLAMLVVPNAQAAFKPPSVASLTNPMVADVSNTAIELHSSFNGTQLLIFGARNVPGELVIIVRGPKVDVRLRRKDRIAGMWMNVDQRKYHQLPLFYALTSTKPLNKIAGPEMLASLGIGESRILSASNSKPDEKFDLALSAMLKEKYWWQSPFGPIQYFGESLFKARIDLPDTLAAGDYTAEVYLFDRGQLLGFQTIPITAFKTGIDATIFDTAQKNGFLYGIFAVLMALTGGLIAHRFFHKD